MEIVILIIALIAPYFIIKWAVRDGIIQAYNHINTKKEKGKE